MLVVACIVLLSVKSEITAGASVDPTPPRRSFRNEGCTLILPADLRFAPIVTDEKTREELVPVQDGRSRGKYWFVRVGRDKEIRVNCGKGNTLSIHDTYYYQRLTCVRGTEFLDTEDDEVLLPDGIGCSDPRKPTPIIHRNGTCSGKGTNFDVEFVTENPKRKLYSVCTDEELSGTLYSTSYIDGKSIASGLVESSGSRPDFRGEEFYPFNIKQAYKWQNAFNHLSELLGSEDLVNQYFPTQQYRFSRGHLFPNADPIKRYEKHATFYYLNTVPQWQNLNGGNWAIIEQDVRDLSANLQTTLNVVTGSFGVTTLADGNNNQVQIWLARDGTGKLRLPVPRFVWKVVHDPIRNAAVAIVQINNPWAQPANSDILCQDFCDKLSWLRSSEFHNSRRGFTYCCDVNELRRKIPYVPHVEYKALLGVGYISNGNENDSGIESGAEGDYDDEESQSVSSTSSSSSSGDDTGYRVKGSVVGTSSTTGNPTTDQSIEDMFASIKLGQANAN